MNSSRFMSWMHPRHRELFKTECNLDPTVSITPIKISAGIVSNEQENIFMADNIFNISVTETGLRWLRLSSPWESTKDVEGIILILIDSSLSAKQVNNISVIMTFNRNIRQVKIYNLLVTNVALRQPVLHCFVFFFFSKIPPCCQQPLSSMSVTETQD